MPSYSIRTACMSRSSQNGIVHLQKITIARDFGTEVEVHDGVKPGDQVILNPMVNLAEGSKVAVREAADELDRRRKGYAMRRLLFTTAILLVGCNACLAQVSTMGSTAMGLPTTPGAIVTSPLNGPGPFSATTQPGTPDTTLAPVPLASDPTTPGTVVTCATPTGQIAPGTPAVPVTSMSMGGAPTRPRCQRHRRYQQCRLPLPRPRVDRAALAVGTTSHIVHDRYSRLDDTGAVVRASCASAFHCCRPYRRHRRYRARSPHPWRAAQPR